MNHHSMKSTGLYRAGKHRKALERDQKPSVTRFHTAEGARRQVIFGQQANNSGLAAPLVEKASQYDPATAYYHNDRGAILQRLGRLDQALEAFNEALRIKPDFAEAHCNRAIVLQRQERLEEALKAFDRALRIKPDLANAHNNRGVILQRQGRLQKALAAFDQAVRVRPDYAEAHSNRGVMLQRLGRPEEALAAHDQALRLEPQHALAHLNRGAALQGLGRLNEALRAFEEALRLKPDLAQAQNNRGNILKDQGQFSEALAAYSEAFRIKPDYAQARSNYLFCMNYDPSQDDAALFAAHRDWGEQFGHSFGAFTKHGNLRDANKMLRVGLVSTDFGRHPVGYFLEALLAAADRSQVRFLCYSGRLTADDLTARLSAHAYRWRSTSGRSDIELAETIRADSIDVLIDLAGHTAGNRLGCFALRPAPIQVHWAGYCHTIPSMDYSLWDPIQVPEGEERWFIEPIVRLPDVRWCYAPPEYAPEVATPPVLERGYITFGSFNNLTKVNSQVLELWARVLKNVPHSRLLLNWRTLADSDECKRFRSSFAAHGIAGSRIELRRGACSHGGVLAEYADVDVALDPFPFSGCLTTCEALWMGLPVITMPITRPVSRQTQALLHAIGRTEWVAKETNDYVRIATDLACDVNRLAYIRRHQRGRMGASPLCDGPRFARNFEAALRRMWHRWCASEEDQNEPYAGAGLGSRSSNEKRRRNRAGVK